KQIPRGVFSSYVNSQLKQGDILRVLPPSGKFNTTLDVKQAKNYVFFAAGSGITPIISLIKTYLALEPNSTVKLFYANRTQKSIIFKEEIEGLKNRYFERFQMYFFLTREQRDIPLLNGRFTSEKIQELLAKVIHVDQVDECFVCGPQSMIFMIRDESIAEGMSEKNIHFELFFTGDENGNNNIEILEEKAEGTQVTIIDGGKEFHFTMGEQYDTVLDSALAAGADLPFACKGGVCSTCKCKVIEGELKMKKNYALEANEVAKGYLLSCQAVPITDKVVVDFDA
ncbi:MAG: 2Fe-2S iron-sulfur cluster binding domain-containing protein, partial [Flavobacteriaceae bacterium]|nr:2Fe-2S iron-sulfur cluster binding domain-containing protein [Flavobacteriaceae bacterium]